MRAGEFAIILWLLAGLVLVIFSGRVDAFLLRSATRLSRKIGELFDADNFKSSRWINRAMTPLAVAAFATDTFRDVTRRGGMSLVFGVLLSMVFFLGRWFGRERYLIEKVEVERAAEMIRGSLSFDLWNELRKERRALYVVCYLWTFLVPAWLSSGATADALLAIATLPLIPATTIVALLLSIEQPPYQYVSVRERLAAMRTALTPQVAS